MLTSRKVVVASRKKGVPSFTLIELLTVMAIISILAALSLMAASAVWAAGARNRARAEIQAMSTGLESYKTDNGIYPQSEGVVLLTNTYVNYDGTMTQYQTNSTLLYVALSGQTNFVTAPAAGTKVYVPFKVNQIANSAGPYSYIRDPWNYSYGYSTGTPAGAPTTNFPYNGNGFFDLWSTGGKLSATANTNAWISNWQ